MSSSFSKLLAERDVIVLDGATGTELERRGFEAPLPFWTADAALRAPDLLHAIHREYLAAGADIVTANTFRTNAYSLRPGNRDAEAPLLTRRSVEIARAACRETGRGLVAGCMAPLEDCYHPERVPPPETTRQEHALHARALADAGVDLLLVETMCTAREAHAAAEAGLATGLPVLVSFILMPDGDGDLLSSEDLEVAWAHLRALEVNGERIAGCMVNCTPRPVALAALERMETPRDPRPIGASANLGGPHSAIGWAYDPTATPEEFAVWGLACRDLGARLVGGCCGTTPAHIAALAAALRS